MVARVARLRVAPDGVDRALEQIRSMLDEFRAQPGFCSLTTLVNRATGECLGISVWADAEAERASRELGRRSRENSSGAAGEVAPPDVEFYQVGFEERMPDPTRPAS